MKNWSDNSSIDWQELDRLVDGRLEESAYRELLCQIDADPNGWKQCALAFLEHQALEKELTALQSDPSTQLLACMGGIESDPEAISLKPASLESSPSNRSRSMVGWVSMALCVVCGLAIGLGLNSQIRDRLVPDNIPPIVEQGMNRVIANQASDASQGVEQADVSVKKRSCKQGKRACWSQRNRTSLSNFKSRTRDFDPLKSGQCIDPRLRDGN